MPYVDNDIPLATKRKRDRDPNDEPYNRSSQRIALSPREEEAPELFDASLSPPATRKAPHPTKRLRAAIRHDAAHDVHSSHRRPSSRAPSTDGAGKVRSTALLPCHVCHRRPTKKSDLDSFARCQSCREQTCFICMRECRERAPCVKSAIRKEDGGDAEALSQSFQMHDADVAPSIPHTDDDDVDVDIGDDDRERKRERYTHHSMICSRCCVEQGAEGEVICLGCLSDSYTDTP